MYFVDRKKIEKMLTCLEQVVDTFQEKKYMKQILNIMR